MKDINDIKDTLLKNAVINAINNKDINLGNSVEVIDGAIVSNLGYIYSSISSISPPYQVNYIVDHIF